jgi:hypothetical protein
MRNAVFWDVGACRSAAICSLWFLVRGFFYPEDSGDTFLRNVCSHKVYTAPHSRRRRSSRTFLFDSRPEHQLSSLTFSMRFVAHPGKCQEFTSYEVMTASSYIFPIHYSLVILPFDATFLLFYLVCEAIGTAATPGLLCQPRLIVKMIVEKEMECRLAGETEVLGENLTRRHFSMLHSLSY